MKTKKETMTDYQQKFEYTKEFVKNHSVEEIVQFGKFINQLPDYMTFTNWKTFVGSYLKSI